MLRFLNCSLPLHWWIRDRSESLPWLAEAARRVNATIVDFSKVATAQGHPMLGGFERKPYSIYHSDFEECMLLDADIVPVRDPTYLFDDPGYSEHGALFWPDIRSVPATHPIWYITGVPPDPDEPGFQGGQQIVNLSRCKWPMEIAMDMNFDSAFWYAITFGEQDTYRFAWKMAAQRYALMPNGVGRLDGALYANDRNGQRVFQHRCGKGFKWTIDGVNKDIPDFWYDRECRQFLDELRDLRESTPVPA
jgi:hypothetical protein